MELGARDGDIAKMLADLHFKNIYCTDINGIQGNRYIELENSNIKYKNIDVLNINFPDSSFDVIGCKSLLGGISKNDPNNINKAIREIYRVLKTGGSFIFAENIEGSIMHKVIRRYFQSSGWHYPKLQDFVQELDSFKQIRFETTGFFTILSKNETIKTYLFNFDEMIKNIVPEKSKYIIYGIAEK